MALTINESQRLAPGVLKFYARRFTEQARAPQRYSTQGGITPLRLSDLAPPTTSAPDAGSNLGLLGLGMLGVVGARRFGQRKQPANRSSDVRRRGISERGNCFET